MKLKTIVLVASCAICGIATTALGYSTSDWNPAGYGNWSEATRWMSGTPLPTEQEKSVLITGADAYATDADYNIRRLTFVLTRIILISIRTPFKIIRIRLMER